MLIFMMQAMDRTVLDAHWMLRFLLKCVKLVFMGLGLSTLLGSMVNLRVKALKKTSARERVCHSMTRMLPGSLPSIE